MRSTPPRAASQIYSSLVCHSIPLPLCKHKHSYIQAEIETDRFQCPPTMSSFQHNNNITTMASILAFTSKHSTIHCSTLNHHACNSASCVLFVLPQLTICNPMFAYMNSPLALNPGLA